MSYGTRGCMLLLVQTWRIQNLKNTNPEEWKGFERWQLQDSRNPWEFHVFHSIHGSLFSQALQPFQSATLNRLLIRSLQEVQYQIKFLLVNLNWEPQITGRILLKMPWKMGDHWRCLSNNKQLGIKSENGHMLDFKIAKPAIFRAFCRAWCSLHHL